MCQPVGSPATTRTDATSEPPLNTRVTALLVAVATALIIVGVILFLRWRMKLIDAWGLIWKKSQVKSHLIRMEQVQMY